MSPLLTTALARVGTAALLFGAGAWAGHALATRADDAATATELRRVSALYLQAVVDGNRRAQALQQQLTDSQTFTADLAQRSRNVPTLVRTSCPQAGPGATHRSPPGAVVAQSARGAGEGAAALPADAAQDAPAEHSPGPGVAGPDAGHPLDAGLGLTAGAVSLWNSALAGELVPTGACSLADPASAACAVGTEVSIEDAWDNQAANAAACRADRARLAALIDFLTQTPHARQTGEAR
jgi:hypothetical protein